MGVDEFSGHACIRSVERVISSLYRKCGMLLLCSMMNASSTCSTASVTFCILSSSHSLRGSDLRGTGQG